MAVAESLGEGRFIQFDTATTTVAIAENLIVELDTSGDVILPTATPEIPIGVTSTRVDARTTASVKKIVVQVSGLAAITCDANIAATAGCFIEAGTSDGLASTAVAATTITATGYYRAVGKCIVPDATTTGTTVVVLLKPC